MTADSVSSGLNEGLKSKLNIASTFMTRLLTGLLIGLTAAIVGEEIFIYGTFLFVFVTLTCLGLFMRLSKTWGLTAVLIFDLLTILFALVLRMYIMIAPG